MGIDVCAIPSFDVEKRALINHYNILLPTEGLLIPVQSLNEALADKFIALAYRARLIKPRDLWDILWLKQRGISISQVLVDQKLEARGKTKDDFVDALAIQLGKLLKDDEVRSDFNAEMSRFIPKQLKERTLDDPAYWAYVQSQITSMSEPLLGRGQSKHRFDMGL
nr:nucleotidyl transferase AbiEii/AbiGii toxin family protein [Rheinheimera sp. YQF-1]